MSLRAYGLGYLGGKNDIAEDIVALLPKADTLVDLFAGGCAITHAALVSGKFHHIICNDTGDAHLLFRDAIHGRYRDERRWISREDFFRLKDTDPYVRWCWSFGNDGRTYIYGRQIEPFKRAFHKAVVFDDWTEYRCFVPMVDEHLERLSGLPTYNRYLAIRREFVRAAREAGYPVKANDPRAELQSLQSLERLQRLESLQSLQSLESLEFTRKDYREVEIPAGAVVYCDPPYMGTYCGSYKGFDSPAFHEWAREASGRWRVLISEYSMPPDFRCVAELRHGVKSAANGQFEADTKEKIWVTGDWYRAKAEQLTLFQDNSTGFLLIH